MVRNGCSRWKFVTATTILFIFVDVSSHCPCANYFSTLHTRNKNVISSVTGLMMFSGLVVVMITDLADLRVFRETENKAVWLCQTLISAEWKFWNFLIHRPVTWWHAMWLLMETSCCDQLKWWLLKNKTIGQKIVRHYGGEVSSKPHPPRSICLEVGKIIALVEFAIWDESPVSLL